MELDEADKVLLRRGMDQMTTANAIMRFLSDYFRDKYGLTPEHQITPDGTIIRTSFGESLVPNENGRTAESIDLQSMQS